MTKWTLQSEKPIQEHFTRPCWVQLNTHAIPVKGQYVFEISPDTTAYPGMITGWSIDKLLKIYLHEIFAWQYVEFPPQPEPYVPAPALPKIKAEWIDGAVRWPGLTLDYGFLVREKGHHHHKAVEWAHWAQEFVWLDPRTQKYRIYKPEDVEWLEVTEEQE